MYAKDFDTVKDFGSFGEHLSGVDVILAMLPWPARLV